MREEQQRDRDRVTRRSGTKMFRGAASPRSAEPIRAFDDDGQRDGIGQNQRYSRDGRARYDERDGRFERDSRRYRDEDARPRDGHSRRRDEYDEYRDDYAREGRERDSRTRDERRYREDDRYRDERRYREDDRYRDERRYREDDRYRDGEYRGGRNENRNDGYERGDRARKEDGRGSRESRSARADRPSSPKKPAAAQDTTNLFVHQVVPYVMFWVALFAAVSFLLRDVAGLDASVGAFGNWFADFLCGLFGIGAYFLPLFLVVLSLKWKLFVRQELLGKKIFLSTSFLLLLSGIIHVFQDVDRAYRASTPTILYAQGVSRAGGGFFGGFVGEWLGYCLRLPGTCLLAIPLLVIVGIYLVGLTPTTLWQRVEVKFKMLRQRRREERGANGGKLASPTPRRTLGEGKTQEAAWKEPQPLAGGNVYDFGDEEADTVVDPIRDAEEKRAERASESEPAHETGAKRAARVRSASEVNELLDIADDEPEFMEPSEDARTILAQAGHTDDARQQVDAILRDMENAAAVAEARPSTQSTQSTQEGSKEGSYYAPFALPVRPEPRRERAAQAATASPFAALHVTEPVAEPVTVTDEASDADPLEEMLGSIRPAETSNPYMAKKAEAPQTPKKPTFPLQASSELLHEWPAGEERENGAATRENASVLFFDEEPRVDEVIGEGEPRIDEVLCVDEEPNEGTADLANEEGAFAIHDEPDFSASEEREDPVVPALRERVEPMAPPTYSAPISATPSAPAASATFTTPTAPRFEVPKAVPVIEKTPIRDEPPAPPAVVPREYVKPPLALLSEDKNVRGADAFEDNEETKQILRDTLESFNVHIKDEVVCSRGPTITRYEVRPEIGVPVRSIINRIDDISLYMEAQVRIAPIQGKAAVGVEVPNKVRETVYLRTLLESEQFKNSKNPVEIALGVGIGGEIQMCDLTAMPHLLVAGATKSGKSVCINTIILSLLYKTSPKDLRLILIDPKRVEFKPYMHLPHLYAPIITEPARAVGALACAVQEMERRYTLLEDVGARNFEGYNERVKNDPDREHLPYLVIIIDEYYDLKMACPNNDLENFACRLAQKARAAGIHLIIGTQRPSVNVITGTLKANIPSRIAFTVMQQVDSRTILDAVGAELLTGRGDMLYAPMGEKPMRLQGSFVSDDEVENIVAYVRDHNDPVQYNQTFMDQVEIEMAKAQNSGKKSDIDSFADSGDDGGEDPKFLDAVKLAVETQKVATSLLQRRLGVGYGRAAKIIDRMEELGLVSASEGNKPRQVLAMAQGYLNHLAVEEEGGSDEFYG